MAKTVGDRVRALRIERGYTQEQLAERAGLASAVSISRYERGETDPSIGTIEALAKVFRVSREYLAWGQS